MNENIALAILQLLAYSARLDGLTAMEKDLVREFFSELVQGDELERFMASFDRYVTKAPGQDTIEQLCARLNSTLTYPQKVIALLRLLQVTTADHDLSENEQKFLSYVTSLLKIDAKQLELLVLFETGSQESTGGWPFNQEQLFTLHSGVDDAANRRFHHHDLPGQLLFMEVEGTDLFFMRPLELSGELTLQGKRLVTGKIYALAPGTTIRVPHGSPIFQSDVVARFRPMLQDAMVTLSAQNVSLAFNSGGWGLRNVNIDANGGQLIAIMGASGSGKSTLLSVLNGNATPTAGKVLINGRYDAHKDHRKVSKIIGYVPQDDLLIEELTVEENLMAAAQLSVPHKTDAELRELVDTTLNRLGLWEARKLRVGNSLNKTISGGQRKRINIGLELLRKPQLLFVDEPTSGLSSHDSENIIDLLRELSLQGNLIFVVIHQPSSTIFKMFNQLLIMDTGGYPIYYGNPLEALVYFRTHEDLLNRTEAECPSCGNVNADEIFQIVERRLVDEYGWEQQERKTKPADWADRWNAHLEKSKHEHTTVSLLEIDGKQKGPSWARQWWVFSWRNAVAKVRNQQYMALALLQAPILALLMGSILRFDRINDLTDTEDYIFRENMNVPVFMFVTVIVSLFMGLLISAEEIIKDRKIKRREAFLNLSWSSYLAAKVLWLFTLSAFQTGVFVAIGNYLMGMTDMTLYFWLVSFSAAAFANMLGLVISDSFRTAVTIYILIPLMLIPQLVFGGVMVRFDNMNPHVSNVQKVPLLGEMMVSRWAFEAMMVYQFGHNQFNKPLFRNQIKAKTLHYQAIVLVNNTLIGKVEALQRSKREGSTEDVEENISILKSFEQKTPAFGKVSPSAAQYIRSLNPAGYTEAQCQQISTGLLALKKAYLTEMREVERQMETTKAGYGTEMQDLMDQHVNDRLVAIVEDATSPDAIVQVGGALYRKYEPIHYIPDYNEQPLDFRAHLYAPFKNFMGQRFPTQLFNLYIIWAFTLLTGVALYFRLGKKLLSR